MGNCSIVHFSLGQLRYAIELSVVERVLQVVEVTPLPGAPDFIEGVINEHGTILPVVNLRRRLHLPHRPIALSDMLLIIKRPLRPVALLVDDVLGVMTKEAADISDSDRTPRLNGMDADLNGLFYIYDPDFFLDSQEEAALDRAIIEKKGER